MIDLEPIKKALKAATAAPWESLRSCPHDFHRCESREVVGISNHPEGDPSCIRARVADFWSRPEDADLCAMLRNSAPALIAEIERLRAELERVR